MRLRDSFEEPDSLLDLAADIDEQDELHIAACASSQCSAELRCLAFNHRWSQLVSGEDRSDPEHTEEESSCSYQNEKPVGATLPVLLLPPRLHCGILRKWTNHQPRPTRRPTMRPTTKRPTSPTSRSRRWKRQSTAPWMINQRRPLPESPKGHW